MYGKSRPFFDSSTRHRCIWSGVHTTRRAAADGQPVRLAISHLARSAVDSVGQGAGDPTKTKILLLRVGEKRQGVVGLFQPGLPGEQSPGLSVRFMGINRSAIAAYLISLYCSLALLTDDAVDRSTMSRSGSSTNMPTPTSEGIGTLAPEVPSGLPDAATIARWANEFFSTVGSSPTSPASPPGSPPLLELRHLLERRYPPVRRCPRQRCAAWPSSAAGCGFVRQRPLGHPDVQCGASQLGRSRLIRITAGVAARSVAGATARLRGPLPNGGVPAFYFLEHAVSAHAPKAQAATPLSTLIPFAATFRFCRSACMDAPGMVR